MLLDTESEGSPRRQARRSAAVLAAHGADVPPEAETAVDHTTAGKSV